MTIKFFTKFKFGVVVTGTVLGRRGESFRVRASDGFTTWHEWVHASNIITD